MTEFYLNNKRYLDLYWNNSISKETLTGKEVGEFWFRCNKCGKEWVLYSLDTLPYLSGCNCRGTIKETAYNERDLLKKFWDYERNTLNVDTIPLRSGKKIALRCPKCSGRWDDYDVADVTFRGKGCPYCSGRRVLKGRNDLLSQCPEVVEKYWDYGKNTVKPDEVYKLSGLKVFWKCRDCNYSWESSVGNFVRGTKKCPKCKGIGVNDLKSLYPELVDKFWDYKKNTVSPSEVTIGSSKPVYCRCKVCGGEWVDIPKLLKNRKVCPVCWGRPKHFTSLRKKRPDLVDRVWNFEKNEKLGLTPDNVSYGSHKKVFLTCKVCGNSWDDWDVHTLSNTKVGCPFCTKQRMGADSNSLLSDYPEVVKEYWDWGINTKRGIYPSKLMPKSNKPINLKCKKCGYSWGDYSPADLVHYKLGCPVCSGQRVKKGFNDFQSKFPDLVKRFWDWDENEITPDNISWGSGKWCSFKCDKCGHKWKVELHDLTTYGRGCPQCAREGFVSKGEKEILDFLKANYSGVIETSKVGLLPNNLELDIYTPEKKIGIEFNGIYWHSELYKDKNKHYTKHKLCKQMGITLFQIWEDQWRDRRPVVERLLLSKLGVLSQKKINARDCIIQEVSKMDAKPFMDENHIQGFVGASVYLGLFTRDGEMVALCQFLRTGKQGEFNLNRYATCESVRGGFTKLLRYFEKVYLPKKVVTFSDNDYSDGGLYRNNGFVLEGVLEPDYYYTDSSFSNRVHKFNYRKEQFKNDLNLYFEEGMTEKELAELNKLTRVWDSGKIRWVKYYN